MMGELDGTSTDCACAALNQQGAALDGTADVYCPVCSDAGDAETSSLGERYAFWQRYNLRKWNNGVLSGCSVRAIGLCAIAPDAPANPLVRDSCTHTIDGARTIAMRDDTGIRHSKVKCVFTLFHIAGIYAGSSDANPNFTSNRLRLFHFTDDQNVSRPALPLIPCCFHRVSKVYK
jgi:hypothetical protein